METIVSRTLAGGWSMLIVRGVLALVLGIIALLMPRLTIALLLSIFGIYAFFDGVAALVAGIREVRENLPAWRSFLEAAVGIFAGVLAFTQPGPMVFALVIVIAIRSIVMGILEFSLASISKAAAGVPGWLLVVAGIVSLAFGVLLIVRPMVGAFALVYLIAIYGIVFGLLMTVVGAVFRVRMRTPATE